MRNATLFCFLSVSTLVYAQDPVNYSVTHDTAKIKHWHYREEADEMSTGKFYMATIDANEKIHFTSSPQDKGAITTITLQNADSVNLFEFFIVPGKFTDYKDDSVALRLRFDDDKAAYYYFRTTPDKTPNAVYVPYHIANLLIEKLKKSKRLRIQTGFNNDGLAISEFNIAGLKWNHFGKEKNNTASK